MNKNQLPSYLFCNTCGKCVSTGFYALPVDGFSNGIVIRAYIECPECIEKKNKKCECREYETCEVCRGK